MSPWTDCSILGEREKKKLLVICGTDEHQFLISPTNAALLKEQ